MIKNINLKCRIYVDWTNEEIISERTGRMKWWKERWKHICKHIWIYERIWKDMKGKVEAYM